VILRLALLLAAAGALATPARPQAANLEVQPVLVELGAGAPSATITVRNGGAAPMRYQVSPMAWTQPDGTETKLAPSSELSAFPLLFSLAAGEERKVRVGATVPPGSDERAWRLLVEELPSAVEPGAGAHVTILTRFAIPVFQAPARPLAAPAAELERAGAAIRVTLRSAGNVHVRPSGLRLTLLGEGGEAVHAADVPAVVVLAKGRRVAEVPVPAELCGKVRSARLDVELPQGPLRSTLQLPDGACAP
jgi:fimbrial chaperone protein